MWPEMEKTEVTVVRPRRRRVRRWMERSHARLTGTPSYWMGSLLGHVTVLQGKVIQFSSPKILELDLLKPPRKRNYGVLYSRCYLLFFVK